MVTIAEGSLFYQYILYNLNMLVLLRFQIFTILVSSLFPVHALALTLQFEK